MPPKEINSPISQNKNVGCVSLSLGKWIISLIFLELFLLVTSMKYVRSKGEERLKGKSVHVLFL